MCTGGQCCIHQIKIYRTQRIKVETKNKKKCELLSLTCMKKQLKESEWLEKWKEV